MRAVDCLFDDEKRQESAVFCTLNRGDFKGFSNRRACLAYLLPGAGKKRLEKARTFGGMAGKKLGSQRLYRMWPWFFVCTLLGPGG